MPGVLFSILGGILVCLQGVFTTRISSKIGLWETNTIVHIVGLALTLLFLAFQGDGDFTKFGQVNRLYLPGLCLGALIVFSVMKGVSSLGPTLSTAILLISQLVVATIIDCGGLFETARAKLVYTKPLGLGIMIAGIIVFKLKDL
jgi:bacterial/archaeal transporter family-2 protein